MKASPALRRYLLSLCGLFGLCGASLSAPPNVTYLYPAGAQRGAAVEVTAAGTLDASAKVWASDRSVTVEVAKGKLKVAVAKDAAPGTYWLRAYNDEGASALRPFLVGTLPEVTEKEPNDDFKKPHHLDGSSYVVNGKLEKNGDVDCFAASLKKGQTLVASLAAHGTLRSPMDGMLQILSADGFVLEENNDFRGLDPQIAYTAKKDGVYIARVYAFPAQPDASIRYFGSDACVYRLTLTTDAFVDSVVPLAVGVDRPQPAEVHGWNLPVAAPRFEFAGTPDDPFAVVHAPRVVNSLRVRNEPHPVHWQKPAKPPAPPFSFSGRIDAPKGEVRVPFAGKKGQTLTVQAESRSLGLAVNPVLRVLDSDGKQLARAEPGKLNSDTALPFNPPADGTYTAAVSDLYAGGGSRHAFLLRVLSEPDYELTVAADRFTAAPGKPATVAVKVNRLRGFAKAVEVVAEGLPEGAKAEVVQPAKPDPSTVTLNVSAEKPVSGAFRLVGKVKDEPNLARVARFAMPEFDDTTADLWLTVAPAAKK